MSAGGHNRLPKSIRSRALQMVKDGYPARDVARKLGIGETTIASWIRRKRAQEEPALPEGIRMLQAWPNRGGMDV